MDRQIKYPSRVRLVLWFAAEKLGLDIMLSDPLSEVVMGV